MALGLVPRTGEDGTVTDSNSTLDDEVDDEGPGDSRETCCFWDSRSGTCHYEMLVLGSEPCADCPPPEFAPED